MKSISFFLQPKQDVTYLLENSTMRQAMEKMEYHGYTALPTIDEHGRYVRTLTEGDLLWKMKNTPDLTFNDTSRISLREVPVGRKVTAVYINSTMEDLLELALNQNFVPVIDDTGIFIGIVTRKAIIAYFIEENLTLRNNTCSE